MTGFPQHQKEQYVRLSARLSSRVPRRLSDMLPKEIYVKCRSIGYKGCCSMSPAALGLLISFRSSRPSKLTILLVHADHDSGVLGPSDNGRENSTGGIVSGESSLYSLLGRKGDTRHRFLGLGLVVSITKFDSQKQRLFELGILNFRAWRASLRGRGSHLAHSGSVIDNEGSL